jgi:hypothetical protein
MEAAGSYALEIRTGFNSPSNSGFGLCFDYSSENVLFPVTSESSTGSLGELPLIHSHCVPAWDQRST